jgi:excisionase family DNA binding protein
MEDHMQNTQSSTGLLTPSEVAKLFRVDPKTVTRWARAGKVTSIRTPGGHRRYVEVEIRALLAGTVVSATPTRPVRWPSHSVGVEKVTPELRNRADVPPGATRAVVERTEGRFSKLCATDVDPDVADVEVTARSVAWAYGATYLPAGGAR